MNPPSAPDSRPWAALVLVQVLFGINYVLSKLIVTTFPPLVWAQIRTLISAFFLLLLAMGLKRKAPKFNPRFFQQLFIFSTLGVVINQTSFLAGLRYTSATNSAILCTLIPIFTLFFVTVSGKEPLTLKRLFGFLSALVGVLVIRKAEAFHLNDHTLLGDLLTLLNCFSYGLFLVAGKKFMESHDPFWSTGLLFMAGGIGMTAISMPSWLSFQWPVISAELFQNLTLSILGGTLLTYLLNNWALSKVRSSSVALFIYLQPIVASLVAWLWLNEAPTPRTVIASVLIFLGMYLGIARH